MKLNDTIVCINSKFSSDDEMFNDLLTINKHYKPLRLYTTYFYNKPLPLVKILCDNGEVLNLRQDYFITLDEYREQILNKLL
jgi:hypothetical protein